MSSTPTNKFRGYVFTINNYDEIQWSDLIHSVSCQYMIYGKEVAPTTGTPHLQGYVWFKNPRTISGILKEYPLFKGAHFIPARGDGEQNQAYCSKEGEYQEIGTPPNQGNRTDLQVVKQIIDAGGTMLDVFEEKFETAVRYSRSLQLYINLKYQHRTEAPKVYWHWGKTGTGKTRRAVEYLGVKETYMKDGSKWWDGYTQQASIVIDDFDGTWPYRDFLRLLDRYAYQGQTKGGYIAINSPNIFITSEYEPAFYWKNGNEQDQVLRRITDVIHFLKPSETWEAVSSAIPRDNRRDGGTEVPG